MFIKIAIISALFSVCLSALPDRTDPAFLADCLSAHNKKRALHQNTPPLAEDPKLLAYAKQRCATVSSYPFLEEDHAGLRNTTGENLSWAATSSAQAPPGTCSAAVYQWYDTEINNYDYDNPGPDEYNGVFGHFTQLIWKSSIRFGCARSYGYKDNWYSTYVCCNYEPSGNSYMIDDPSAAYIENVQPLI